MREEEEEGEGEEEEEGRGFEAMRLLRAGENQEEVRILFFS